MTYQWSENAAHIQSLYWPWKLGDGFDDAVIESAEKRLGVGLPVRLREFYRWWGQREDLTRTQNFLLRPHDITMKNETVEFWVENQAVWLWGIDRDALDQDDPPVVVAENKPPLVWQASHHRLSLFLDSMAYLHAFWGGAMHGGWAEDVWTAEQLASFKTPWRRLELPVSPPYMLTEAGYTAWPLIVRDGCAVDAFGGVSVVGTQECVDQLSRDLHLEFEHQW